MSSYVRDDNGALINTDDSQYRALLAARESQKQAQELQRQLDSVHNDMHEIREMIKSLGIKNEDGKTGS